MAKEDWKETEKDEWIHISGKRSIEIRWTAFGYSVSGIGNLSPFYSKEGARIAAIEFMKVN
jgi:hypothetical protein